MKQSFTVILGAILVVLLQNEFARSECQDKDYIAKDEALNDYSDKHKYNRYYGYNGYKVYGAINRGKINIKEEKALENVATKVCEKLKVGRDKLKFCVTQYKSIFKHKRDRSNSQVAKVLKICKYSINNWYDCFEILRVLHEELCLKFSTAVQYCENLEKLTNNWFKCDVRSLPVIEKFKYTWPLYEEFPNIEDNMINIMRHPFNVLHCINIHGDFPIDDYSFLEDYNNWVDTFQRYMRNNYCTCEIKWLYEIANEKGLSDRDREELYASICKHVRFPKESFLSIQRVDYEEIITELIATNYTLGYTTRGGMTSTFDRGEAINCLLELVAHKRLNKDHPQYPVSFFVEVCRAYNNKPNIKEVWKQFKTTLGIDISLSLITKLYDFIIEININDKKEQQNILKELTQMFSKVIDAVTIKKGNVGDSQILLFEKLFVPLLEKFVKADSNIHA